MDILKALDDPKVFATQFRHPATWSSWRVFLAALFGLPLDEPQRQLFQQCTGRTTPLASGHSEAWLVCGRRAGKSFVLALTAVYLATFRDWRSHLGPGERATVMIVAADRRQARVIMRSILGLLRGVPMLAQTIENERAESIDLINKVTIEIHSASFKTTRGYTICAALCDELAFWPTEDSASPDYAILDAVRPGMATIPGAMLLCASSPYARRGALWDAHRRHYGKDGDPVLVWRATTRVMNSTVPQSVVDEAAARDPASAAAEYLAEFRSDIEAFLSREAVTACITPDVRERPPITGVQYYGFVDPSGGSSDSMTLAITHRDHDRVVLDALREVRPPFSPESVVAEFSQLLKSYRITTVRGDRYAGEWPREQFRKRNIEYRPSDKNRSELYIDLLPAVNSRRLEFLDHDRLATQLSTLERHTSRAGRDAIDHAPGQHDDIANAVAGAVGCALSRREDPMPIGLGGKVFSLQTGMVLSESTSIAARPKPQIPEIELPPEAAARLEKFKADYRKSSNVVFCGKLFGGAR